jgi:hypothetical protein
MQALEERSERTIAAAPASKPAPLPAAAAAALPPRRRFVLSAPAAPEVRGAPTFPLDSPEQWVRAFSSDEMFGSDFKQLRASFDAAAVPVTHAGFIRYLHACWAAERGAVLRPDMVWHTLVNEVASAVLADPAAYRDLFTKAATGKTEIVIVTRDDLDVGELVAAMRTQIGDPAFAALLCDTRFASEAPGAHTATLLAFAEAGTPYFDYVTTRCGIPSVDVVGSRDEWVALLAAVRGLQRYVPSGGKWLGAAVRAVDAILHWAFAEPDTDGGDYADAAAFFADTFHYGANPMCGSGHEPRLVCGWARGLYACWEEDLDRFPSHVRQMPYKDRDTGRMYVQAGGLAYSEATADGAFEPGYGFVTYEVIDKDTFKQLAKE